MNQLSEYEKKKLRDWIETTVKEQYKQNNGETATYIIEPFKADDGFQSSLHGVKILTKSSTESIVVKTLPTPDGKNSQDVMGTAAQFKNEGMFFSTVLPLLLESVHKDVDQIASLFPVCHIVYDDEYQSLIALENLSVSGFKLAEKTLDIDHMLIAMKSLGQFHGLSYASKNRSSVFLETMAKNVRCSRYYPALFPPFVVAIKRCLEYGRQLFCDIFPEEYSKCDTKLKHYIDSFDGDVGKERILNTVRHDEPLSVLCHGDFTRNNIMFKYNNENHPVAMKFVDFQLMTYSPPSLDISVLLYLNTTPETREQYWNEIFESYRAGVIETLEKCADFSQEQAEDLYSVEKFKNDFTQYGVHGIFISIFFLQMTMLDASKLFDIINNLGVDTFSEEGSLLFMEQLKKVNSFEVKRRMASLMKELIARHII